MTLTDRARHSLSAKDGQRDKMCTLMVENWSQIGLLFVGLIDEAARASPWRTGPVGLGLRVAGDIEAIHPPWDGSWIFARASLITNAAQFTTN